MTRLDMVRAAIEVLGEQATADQVVRFVDDRFGETIGAKFVPVYRATLRGQAEWQRARARAAEVLADGREAQGAGERRTDPATAG
jgi:hypothetical protein